MQSQRDIERRRELALDQHAGDVRWEGAVGELPAVDAAEDDCGAGKDRLSLAKHEIERGTHDGDDDVDPLLRVLGAKEIPQETRVAWGGESTAIHDLAIQLDRLARFPCECLRQLCVEDGESGQVDTL